MSINNLSINNFNNICRTCSQTTNLVSIQENIYLIEILTNTIHIEIQLNDELPKNICLNCIKELNQSYAFISKCRTNDAVFRQCLIQQKLLDSQKNCETQNKLEKQEEIFIKTELSDIEELISDECSKDPTKQSENTQNQQFTEIENKTVRETNENVCTNCDKSFATNAEFVSHLTDCQFGGLVEPMELNESSDDEFHDDPLDVSESSFPDVSSSNLTERSRTKYQREHSLFLAYCKQKNSKEFTEDVVLDYFLDKAKTSKSATLWCSYSMLKNTLIDDNVDISKYPKLMAFLKQKTVNYKGKISFTREQINQFLREAPDKTYLMMKVALIMGIAGACHIEELMRMTMDHIEDKDSVLVVTIPTTRLNKTRTFFITSCESDWLAIYRKYYARRVTLKAEHRRFFVKYKDGKFINQPVGKNTFGRFPKLIAEYLKLPNPAQYTGRCFRRTSALWFNHLRGHRKSVLNEEDSQ